MQMPAGPADEQWLQRRLVEAYQDWCVESRLEVGTAIGSVLTEYALGRVNGEDVDVRRPIAVTDSRVSGACASANLAVWARANREELKGGGGTAVLYHRFGMWGSVDGARSPPALSMVCLLSSVSGLDCQGQEGCRGSVG
jgi:hypothetical protein